jgi:hypothetical protein
LITKTRLKIALCAVAASIAIVFIILFAFIKPAFEYGLQRAGFKDGQIEQADFAFSGTTLKNIQLDRNGSTVGEVRLYATLSDVLGGKLTKIEISDAKLKWPLQLEASGNAGGALNLVAKQVVLTNAVATVTTAAGELPVTFSGTVVDRDTEYKADIDVGGDADFAKFSGKLTAEIVKDSRLAKLHFELAEAKVAQPDFDMKRVTGFINVDIDPAKPFPLPNAELDFGALSLYGLPLQRAKLVAGTADDKIQLAVQAHVPNESGDINFDLVIDRKDPGVDSLSLKGEAKLKKLDALGIANLKGEGNLLLALNGARAKDAGGDLTRWENLQGSAGLAMDKLSLPGLLKDAEAIATVKLALDPAQQTIVAQVVDGAMSFSGTFRPAGTSPVFISIPADPKNPAMLAWDRKQQTLKADFTGANFTGFDVQARQVDSRLTAYLSDAPVLEGKLNVGELAHMALPKEQFFIPVRVNLEFHSLSSARGATGISGGITEKNGRLSARIEGRHDTQTDRGELSIGMPPTSLVQNVTGLATLFPLSANYMQDAYGVLGLSGDFGWGKGKSGWVAASHGKLYLKDFNATVKGNAISGINAVMDLDSLFPLQVTRQQVAVGAINAGMPLTNGLVEISLAKGGLFTLHSATWTLAKGQITSSPFTMSLADMSTDVTLTAAGLDLSELFRIAPMEGLNATGSVRGTLPIYVRNGAFSVVNGFLETSGPGTISYSPDKMPAFLRDTTQKQLIDLRTALTQFNYDSLSMTVNGQMGQSQKIVLNVKGKNPLFYNGRPVDFHLNLEGPLENVLKYNPGGSHIPDSIRQQLEAYEAKNARL